MAKKEYRIFQTLFAGSFFAFGLFYEYMACIFCGALGFLCAAISMGRKRMAFYLNLQSLTIVAIAFLYSVACFYGVDAGMGWIGFFKKLGVLFFLCAAMQATEKERESLLGLVPAVGCVMTAAGVFAGLWEPGLAFFYMSGRLGGFFQYPNVFALFCLIGMIILTGKDWERRKGWLGALQMAVLLAGVFLSGSRTVLAMTLAVCIIQVFRKRQWRKPLAAMLLLAFTCAGGYVAVSGNVQNVGRFLTVSSQSGGFQERVLQVKDGLGLCLKHPFGLGYLGYYFLEPGVQTGVYSVRFVHNGALQMALDIGIFPALLFLYAFGREIFRKGIPFERQLALTVVVAHCLLDFDLEFPSVWFLLILLTDCRRGREINIAAGGKLAFYKILALALSCGGLYAGLAMLPRHLGRPELSVRLLPFYTEAGREALIQETDGDRAKELAEGIQRRNRYVAEAYDVLAAVAHQKRDFRGMAENKMESVRLRRYYMEGYERCIIMLSQGVEAASVQGDAALARELLEDVAEVGELLRETEERTDPIAYRLTRKPDFTLQEEVEEYIIQAKRMVDEWRKGENGL